MPVATDTLPWSSLSLRDDQIPWDELRTLADAAVDSADVRERLMAELTHHLDRRYAGDEASHTELVDLGVPAVFALAADRLDDAAKRRVADFLVDVLERAGAEDDDFLLETVEFAAGRLGPAVVAPALRIVEAHGTDASGYPFEISLLHNATQADRATRVAVARACVAQYAPDEILDELVASVLIALNDVEPLADMPELRGAIDPRELAEMTEHFEGYFSPEQPWDAPLEPWLANQRRKMLEYLEDDTEDDRDDDPELAEDKVFDEIDDVVERFTNSDTFASLPEDSRLHGPHVAHCFLTLAFRYEGAPPDALNERTVEHLVLDVLPRQVSGDREYFESAPPAMIALLAWLEGTGVLPDSAPLIETVRQNIRQFVSRSLDTQYWGMAKHMLMSALEAGVDPTDEDQMARFMAEYNARLFAASSKSMLRDYVPTYDIVDDPAEEPLMSHPRIRPAIRDTPRVGRNDRCPCGSGRKYKKCCLR